MKKRFALYSMFAAMAIFATACGDDSSSGPEEESSSSIEVEDESSSSVEEEGKSSAKEKDAKSSSSEAKKGDSSSSEEATSSSSAAVSSSSEISYEPTCNAKKNGQVLTVDARIYTEDKGEVKQIVSVDYENFQVSQILDFASLGLASCEDAEKRFGNDVKCSLEDETVELVVETFSTKEELEEEYWTIEYAEKNACSSMLSAFTVDTTALNQEMLAAGKYGTFRDTRDAMLYRTIKIGDQTWMAQNLLYETESGSVTDGHERFYTWEAATGACPTGWDLPTKADFEELILLVDEEYKSIEDDNSEFDFEKAKNLVSAETWDDFKGNDSYGFSVVAAGYYDYGYQSRGMSASFWTKTSSSSNVYALSFFSDYSSAGMMLGMADETRMKTIRCIKKDSAPAQPGVSK